jgi:16S rRNA (adenine1518-N6/adenine1519-N6)-dimethyltransferase
MDKSSFPKEPNALSGENLTSLNEVKALFERYSIAPLKRFGQNFLIDGNVADKTAAAALPEGANAIEIGPGLGALTSRLMQRAKAAAAYEIDSGLMRVLADIFKGAENITFFHEDFLKADIEKEIPPLLKGDIYVAANLPYYITTDCIMKLLTADLNIKRITIMVQKEFTKRLLAAPGSEGYGILSAAARYLASSKVLFDVSPECFYPRPGVSSSVVSIEPKQIDKEKAGNYLNTVKKLFAARRKTVKSNLKISYGLSNEEADSVIMEAGINENARAENLSVTELAKLAEILKNNIRR